MFAQNRSNICTVWNKFKNKINYFGDMSSLHGVGRVFSTSYLPGYKRMFWLIILTLCSLGAAGILRGALSLYSDGAVSYLVETDYLDWDTPFPAVTICERLDADRVKAYLIRNKIPISMLTFYKEVSFWNVKYCRACVNCKLNKTCEENYLETVDKIRLKCIDLLTECWWNNKPFACCDRFHLVNTEYGVCFAFNSRLTSNGSILTVNRRVGLPYLDFTATKSVLIRVHSPDDVMSIVTENVLGRTSDLPPITDLEASLKVEQTISDASLSTLSHTYRGCLFKHERPDSAALWPYNQYTYSACVMYCRALSHNYYCNCTHHFIVKLKGIPVCDVNGLACLNKNKDSLGNLKCDCPMSCEEIQYKAIHVFYKRYTGKLTEELLARGSKARIRLPQLPVLRVRRHAIRDMLGLVVDIGGVGGVFFGASLLSVIEIIYLIFIRRAP